MSAALSETPIGLKSLRLVLPGRTGEGLSTRIVVGDLFKLVVLVPRTGADMLRSRTGSDDHIEGRSGQRLTMDMRGIIK